MAQTAGEVRVAGTGKVYIGAACTDTASFTTASTALSTGFATAPAGYKELGYVTEDGVTFNFNRETEDLNAWQGDKIRVLSLKEPKSVEFALMQTSTDVLTAAFGGGTVAQTKAAGTGSGAAATPAEMKFTPPAKGANAEHALVVEFTDGTITYRYFFPRVAQEGEISFTLTRAGAVTYPITFGALDFTPPYEIYTNDPALKVSP